MRKSLQNGVLGSRGAFLALASHCLALANKRPGAASVGIKVTSCPAAVAARAEGREEAAWPGQSLPCAPHALGQSRMATLALCNMQWKELELKRWS